MLLCSGVSGNECKIFQPQFNHFNTYYECARYGYDTSSKIMNNFDSEFIDQYRTYIVFSCEENKTI